MRSKSISLTMRGFSTPLNEVAAMSKVPFTKAGAKGDFVKAGATSILVRSFILFSMELPSECRIDEMLPILWKHLDGVDALCNLRDAIAPEFVEVDFTLPVKGSLAQEGGFLTLHSLEELVKLRATVSFQFL